MMCVQPIRIHDSVYSNLIDDDAFINTLNGHIDGHISNIEWLDNFTDKYRKFRGYRPIQLPENIPAIEELKLDFTKDQFKVGGKLNLGEYIDIGKSNVSLIVDNRFYKFFIIYELSFSTPKELLKEALGFDLANNLKSDLYNTLRRMLVKETKDSQISDWGQSIRRESLSFVESLISESVDTSNTVEKLVMIGKNTGNITFYFQTDPKGELKQAILKCNFGAESIRREVPPIIDDNNACYCFVGRFHSIISLDHSHYLRYFPIQFHMQFMWFVTGYYLEILENLNDDITRKSTGAFLKKRLEDVDLFVNQIQFLIMHNEKFKLSIELDHELVLKKIEKNWNIEKSLTNAAQYVSMFKEYIGSRHSKRQEQATQRQNIILFAISCIQFIALLSVWADYLSITNTSKLLEKSERASFFDNATSLLTFNTWLPALLGVFVLLFVGYGLRKKK